MKRITIEAEEEFVNEFSKYCIENKISKKKLITQLINKEILNKGKMKQYNGIITNRYRPFMNKENYERLCKLEIENNDEWNMQHNLEVNTTINTHFTTNDTLKDLLISDNKPKELKIPYGLLDHNYYMKFNYNKEDYKFENQVYGIMTFPYIDFEDLKDIINTWNTEFWNIYIINPMLMRYNEGQTLGLFITPVHEEAIEIVNGFFLGETGYKLFYYWTDKKINPITKDNSKVDINQWFKIFTDDKYPLMAQNIVKFWYENKDKLEYNSMRRCYFEFTHKLPSYFPSILNTTFNAKKGYKIEMINTKTKKTIGKCKQLEFDIKAFNCVYMDHKVINFDKEMMKDFEDGNYEIKIIKS